MKEVQFFEEGGSAGGSTKRSSAPVKAQSFLVKRGWAKDAQESNQFLLLAFVISTLIMGITYYVSSSSNPSTNQRNSAKIIIPAGPAQQ